MEITTAKRDEKFIAAFSGHLNEKANLRKLNVDDYEMVFLNFAEIKSVNSIGIKTWVDWVEWQREDTNFVFQELPPVLINTLNTVEGMLPFTSVCESFYAPYYNSENDISKNILLKLGENYTQQEFDSSSIMTIKDEHNLTFEFDGIAKKYFKFLEKFFVDIKINN